MPWFKVDDTLALHPKVAQAGNAAMGLWIRAGSWSAQHLTDGFVPDYILPPLGGRPTDAKRLVSVGLWIVADGGWQFHDWQRFQPSRVEVLANREAERERKAKARAKASGRRPGGQPVGQPNGVHLDSLWVSGHPDPTRPDPLIKDDGSVSLHLPTEPRETDGVTTLSAVNHG